jgi:hypothetical protein
MAFITGHPTGNKEGWSKRVDLCLIRKSAIRRRSEGLSLRERVSPYGVVLDGWKQLVNVLVVSAERLLHQTNFKKCSW